MALTWDNIVITDDENITESAESTTIFASGVPGEAGTIDEITVETLPYTSSATVENLGTANHARIKLGIPRGAIGPAATVSVGSVEAVDYGREYVANSGDQNHAILNFGIPVAERGTDAPPARFYFPDLSAGHYSGSCSLVTISDKTILFDCSLVADADLIIGYLTQLYNDHLFNNIDYIVISHYHNDHIGNLEEILDTFPHAGCKVYLPPSIQGHYPAGEYPYLVTNYNNIISLLTARNVSYEVVTTDKTEWILPGYFSIEMFNTTPEDYAYYDSLETVYNNYSLMTLIQCGEVNIMYPGDIQRAAQIRVMSQRELPRLFLYAVHHHGIQNDDYIPYLEAIDPIYSIISTSHNRALVSAASSYSGNYLSGDVGSTGFSEYVYECGKFSGQILKGVVIPKIGWAYSYVDMYVDNEYDGAVHNGLQETPFTEISEAISFVAQNGNLLYRIHIKGTSTRYKTVWLRDFYTVISLIGYKDKNGANVYPSTDFIYVRNCGNIQITHLNVDGAGREVEEVNCMVYVLSSTCYFSGCEIDGSNHSAASEGHVHGLLIQETKTVYLTGCKIQNGYRGIVSNRYGAVGTNEITFSNLSSACYVLSNLEALIRGNDVVENDVEGYYLAGAPDNGNCPVISYRGNLTTAKAAKCSTSAISQPFYYSTTYPLCVLSKGKIIDIITGNEVTIS